MPIKNTHFQNFSHKTHFWTFLKPNKCPNPIFFDQSLVESFFGVRVPPYDYGIYLLNFKEDILSYARTCERSEHVPSKLLRRKISWKFAKQTALWENFLLERSPFQKKVDTWRLAFFGWKSLKTSWKIWKHRKWISCWSDRGTCPENARLIHCAQRISSNSGIAQRNPDTTSGLVIAPPETIGFRWGSMDKNSFGNVSFLEGRYEDSVNLWNK